MSRWFLHPERNNFFKDICPSWNNRLTKEIVFRIPKNKILTHAVSFINLSPWDSFKEITIAADSEGGVHVLLESSLGNEGNFPAILSEWVKQQGNCSGINLEIRSTNTGLIMFPWYRIDFPNVVGFNNFIAALGTLEHLSGLPIFTQDIGHEFQLIADFYAGIQDRQFSHSLPIYVGGAPNKRTISTIFPLIRAHDAKKPLQDNSPNGKTLDKTLVKQIKYCLSQGADPNETEPLLGSFDLLAQIARYSNAQELLELLLFYGADPTRRLSTQCYSFLDRCHSTQDRPLLHMLTGFFSKMKRSLPLKVQSLSTAIEDQRLVTYIGCSRSEDTSGRISEKFRTELTPHITKQEADDVLRLCEESFVMPNDATGFALKTAVLVDLNKPEAMIELIRNEDSREIRGFIIFEWLSIKNGVRHEDRELRVLYCSLASIEPKLRDTGLIPFLLWRPAYAAEVDLIGLLAITWKSFRLAKGLFWPKYQPDHLEPIVRHFLSALELGNNSRYFHDSFACFVTNQLMRRNEASLEPSNILGRVFYREFLSEPSFRSQFKASPILFYVSDESERDITLHCEALGIDFFSHLRKFAPELASAIRKFPLRTASLPRSKSIFWDNRKVPSNRETPNLSSKLRSKL